MSVKFSIDNRVMSSAGGCTTHINDMHIEQKRCLTGEKNYQKILSLIEIIFFITNSDLPSRMAWKFTCVMILFHGKQFAALRHENC